MRKAVTAMLWMAPFALHSTDALAWGLYTHLYFAQLLLWAIPLADPRFRRAVRRFPELLLAGACLPDVSLFSGWLDNPDLATTHRWPVAQRLLRAAGNDADAALAAGYACHLFSDIVAHHHFVPAHETLWPNPAPLAVHAAAEWAMDAHLAGHLFAHPHHLLRRHLHAITDFASRHFDITPAKTRQALRCLARAEQWLRGSGLHHVTYRGARIADAGFVPRLDYYVAQTAQRLEQMNRVLAGDAPAWAPEPVCTLSVREGLRRHGRTAIAQRLPLPESFFR